MCKKDNTSSAVAQSEPDRDLIEISSNSSSGSAVLKIDGNTHTSVDDYGIENNIYQTEKDQTAKEYSSEVCNYLQGSSFDSDGHENYFDTSDEFGKYVPTY